MSTVSSSSSSPVSSGRGASVRDAEFARLALPLLPVVARLARLLTRDEGHADDVVQETYLRAYRYWHSFDPSSDCRRWLTTICRHAWFDMLQRERHVTVVEDAELESLAAARVHKAAAAAGLGDMYSRLDLGAAIARALASLDAPFREVLVLSDVEGWSYQEIAKMLDIPIGTVRSRLYRGRRQLQQDLMVYALDAGFVSVTNKSNP